MLDTVLNILIYAIPGLAFLVIVHELGHLLVARWSGIGVEAFSIFFGRALYKFNWKGIEWRLGWIPFGGYCKMKGQEDFGTADSKGDPDEFYKRPAWARLLAVLAGPFFNIVLGFILFVGITYFFNESIVPNSQIIVDPISQKKLNLQNGDIIKKVDGKEIHNWNELNESLIYGIHKDNQVLTVERNGKSVDVSYNYDIDKRISRDNGFKLPSLVRVLKVKEKMTVQKGVEKVETPAFKAGIKKGNLILAVDNQAITSNSQLIYELNKNPDQKEYQITILPLKEDVKKIIAIDGKKISDVSQLNALISSSKDKFSITYKDSKGTLTKDLPKKMINITPSLIERKIAKSNKINKYKIIGIQVSEQHLPGILNQIQEKNYSVFEAIPRGVEKAYFMLYLAIVQFKIFTQVKPETLQENVKGPIGIFDMLGKSGAAGFGPYFSFIAMLSILLGVFNLLPIPAVDGGHVVITLFEMIRRKPLSLKMIQRIQIVGVFIVISLAVLITSNDIYNHFIK